MFGGKVLQRLEFLQSLNYVEYGALLFSRFKRQTSDKNGKRYAETPIIRGLFAFCSFPSGQPSAGLLLNQAQLPFWGICIRERVTCVSCK